AASQAAARHCLLLLGEVAPDVGSRSHQWPGIFCGIGAGKTWRLEETISHGTRMRPDASGRKRLAARWGWPPCPGSKVGIARRRLAALRPRLELPLRVPVRTRWERDRLDFGMQPLRAAPRRLGFGGGRLLGGGEHPRCPFGHAQRAPHQRGGDALNRGPLPGGLDVRACALRNDAGPVAMVAAGRDGEIEADDDAEFAFRLGPVALGVDELVGPIARAEGVL